MSATIALVGPALPVTRGVEILRAIAHHVFGRPVNLAEVSRETLPDRDGRDACWERVERDGDVELRAFVANGEGNPRDGYGYTVSAKLLGPYRDQTSHWRAEFYGGGWEPTVASPIRLHLLGVTPEAFAAIRADLATLLPEHRDTSLEDPYAVRETLWDFEHHGHLGWVREFLSGPIAPGLGRASEDLCAKKVALLGPDLDTVRTWLSLAPHASAAWLALAGLDGDAETPAGDARFLAALTHPFDLRTIEAAGVAHPLEARALLEAMAHIFLDDRWRFLDEADRDAFERARDGLRPAPSRAVTWTCDLRYQGSWIDAQIGRRLGVRAPERIEHLFVAGGPPLAQPGTLPSRHGVGAGRAVRRALLDRAAPVARSVAMASCHVNCEDRLSSFGLAWLSPELQVVWRSSLTELKGRVVRTEVAIDVIDRGEGRDGEVLAASLASGA